MPLKLLGRLIGAHLIFLTSAITSVAVMQSPAVAQGATREKARRAQSQDFENSDKPAKNTSTAKQTSSTRSADSTGFRTWELRTAPIALLARWYTLDVAYRFTENFATGPAVVLYDALGDRGGMLAPTYKGYAFGWQGNFYLNSILTDTWYFGLRAYYESYRSYLHGVLGYDERNGVRTNAFFGYQWKWSRVTLMSGLGVEYLDRDVVRQRELGDALGVIQSAGSSRQSLFEPMIEVKMGFEI